MMRRPGGHRDGPPNDVRRPPSHISLLSSAGVAGRHRSSPSATLAHPIPRASLETRSSPGTAESSYGSGFSSRHHGGETTWSYLPSSRCLPSLRQERHAILEHRTGSLPQNFFGDPTEPFLFQRAAPTRPFPVRVPRGCSSFPAAAAACSAISTAEEARGRPTVTQGEAVPSVSGIRRRVSRHFSSNFDLESHLYSTRPSTVPERSIRQGFLPAQVLESRLANTPRPWTTPRQSAHDLHTRQQRLVSPASSPGPHPNPQVLRSTQRSASEESEMGVRIRNCGMEFLPTFSAAEESNGNERSNAVTPEDSRGPASAFSGGRRGGVMFHASAAESMVAEMRHRLATSMVRSVFSVQEPPLRTAVPIREFLIGGPPNRHQGPPNRHQAPLHHITPHLGLTPRETATRRVFVGSSGTFLMYDTSASTRTAQFMEHQLGLLMAELERSFGFGDNDDFDCGIFIIGSDGDIADAHRVAQGLVNEETPVPIRQAYEANNLLNSLERHTIKWTYGAVNPGSTSRDNKCKGNGIRGVSVEAASSASSSSKAANKVQTEGAPSKSKEQAVGAPSKNSEPVAGVSNANIVAAPNTNRVGPPSLAAPSPNQNGPSQQTQNGKECCICLNSFESGESLRTLRCLHIFHADCLHQWIRTSFSVKCPLCCIKIAQPQT